MRVFVVSTILLRLSPLNGSGLKTQSSNLHSYHAERTPKHCGIEHPSVFKFEGLPLLVMAGAYFCFCYVVSPLRSLAALMVDILLGLSDFAETRSRFEHFVCQVKGEDHSTQQHLFLCVNITSSGLSVWNWLG